MSVNTIRSKRLRWVLIIISIVLLIISLMNLASVFSPISKIGKSNAVERCEELGITKEDNQSTYVTREEFLEAMLRCIGMSDTTIANYQHATIEGVEVCEVPDVSKWYYIFGDAIHTVNNQINHHENTEEINSVVEKYHTLCKIAAQNECLQTYLVEDERSPYKHEFRGVDFISIREAITMMQGCLCNADTDDGKILKNSPTYYLLYAKAHFNGLIRVYEPIYWSFVDVKLTREDMMILLSRLLNKKEYRYITDSIVHGDGLVAHGRRHTYYEYLTNRGY